MSSAPLLRSSTREERASYGSVTPLAAAAGELVSPTPPTDTITIDAHMTSIADASAVVADADVDASLCSLYAYWHGQGYYSLLADRTSRIVNTCVLAGIPLLLVCVRWSDLLACRGADSCKQVAEYFTLPSSVSAGVVAAIACACVGGISVVMQTAASVRDMGEAAAAARFYAAHLDVHADADMALCDWDEVVERLQRACAAPPPLRATRGQTARRGTCVGSVWRADARNEAVLAWLRARGVQQRNRESTDGGDAAPSQSRSSAAPQARTQSGDLTDSMQPAVSGSIMARAKAPAPPPLRSPPLDPATHGIAMDAVPLRLRAASNATQVSNLTPGARASPAAAAAAASPVEVELRTVPPSASRILTYSPSMLPHARTASDVISASSVSASNTPPSTHTHAHTQSVPRSTLAATRSPVAPPSPLSLLDGGSHTGGSPGALHLPPAAVSAAASGAAPRRFSTGQGTSALGGTPTAVASRFASPVLSAIASNVTPHAAVVPAGGGMSALSLPGPRLSGTPGSAGVSTPSPSAAAATHSRTVQHGVTTSSPREHSPTDARGGTPLTRRPSSKAAPAFPPIPEHPLERTASQDLSASLASPAASSGNAHGRDGSPSNVAQPRGPLPTHTRRPSLLSNPSAHSLLPSTSSPAMVGVTLTSAISTTTVPTHVRSSVGSGYAPASPPLVSSQLSITSPNAPVLKPQAAPSPIRVRMSDAVEDVASLSALEVSLRLRRRENFMVYLMSSSALRLRISTSVAIPVPFTRYAEQWLLTILIDPVLSHTDGSGPGSMSALARIANIVRIRARLAGALALLCAPVLAFVSALAFLARQAEDINARKDYLGPRAWSPLSLQRCRDYNELPHAFEERMAAAEVPAARVLTQTSASAVSNAIRPLLFVASLLLAALLILAVVDENILLYVHVGDRNLLWVLGICGVVVTAARTMVNDDTSLLLLRPEQAIHELVAYIHYMPRSWLQALRGAGGSGGARRVAADVASMYPYRMQLFALELVGAVMFPLFLLFQLPAQADALVRLLLLQARVHDTAGICAAAATFTPDALSDDVGSVMQPSLEASRMPPSVASDDAFLQRQRMHSSMIGMLAEYKRATGALNAPHARAGMARSLAHADAAMDRVSLLLLAADVDSRGGGSSTDVNSSSDSSAMDDALASTIAAMTGGEADLPLSASIVMVGRPPAPPPRAPLGSVAGLAQFGSTRPLGRGVGGAATSLSAKASFLPSSRDRHAETWGLFRDAVLTTVAGGGATTTAVLSRVK